MTALRFNHGKLSLGSIPIEPLKALAEVYTKGAHKYTLYENDKGEQIYGRDIPFEEAHNYKVIESGKDNWKKGLNFKDIIDSADRHWADFKAFKDIDPDLGTQTLSNLVWNIFAIQYFQIYRPELDNRDLLYYPKRVGLDIDGVLADFVGHLGKYTGLYIDNHQPSRWNDPKIREAYELIKDDHEFWLSMPPLIDEKEILFDPVCYITSRPIPSEITIQWLKKFNFPTAPVITVGTSKVEAAKEYKLDLYIDDSYTNFLELNKNGIRCFLFNASHNAYLPDFTKRVKSMKEFSDIVFGKRKL